MTDNSKPRVWKLWTHKNDQINPDFIHATSFEGHLNPDEYVLLEPVISLAAYQALQAENEFLKKLIAESNLRTQEAIIPLEARIRELEHYQSIKEQG